jgi:peptide/nickel transport system permease protein
VAATEESRALTLEPAAAPTGAAKLPESRTRGLTIGGALTAAGVVLIVIALFVATSQSSSWRTVIGLAGGAVLWAGLQRLGRVRFGPDFRLGLWVAIAWMVLMIVFAVFAPIMPIDGYDKVGSPRLERPGVELDQPLGRDSFGRSELSRVIYGARTSLTIVTLAVGLGFIAGGLFGLLGGYFGGVIDAVIGVFANATLAFPPLVLLLAIVAVFERSLSTLAIGLAIVTVPTFSRLMRAQTITLKQREFVLAARAMGSTNRRIMFRDILPNAILPVATYCFLLAAVLLVAEGSLSYLGLGIPPPRPTWGGMIADGQIKLKTDPHQVFVPAFVLFFTVLALNRVGQWARSAVLGERSDGR